MGGAAVEVDRLATLVASVTGYGVATFDARGRITALNAGAEEMTGYRADELVGAPASRLYAPEDVDAGIPEGALRRAATERHVRDERVRVRKDGSRFWASFELVALRGPDGALLGFGEIACDVSERRRAEGESRQRADELATILSSIGDGVVVTDAEGRVTLLNGVAEALTGYTLAEARGRPLVDVFRIVNEHTRATVENPTGKVLATGTIVGLANHTVLIAKDGTERPIADSAAPVRDGELTRGVVLVFRDQTAERAAERALRESEERFRLLVESSRDYAIFMLDPGGHVVSWNPGAQRIKGYRADEIVGEHFSIFYEPHEVAAGKPPYELAVAEVEGRFEDEGYRVRKDGTRFWANVIISAVRDETGALRGFSKVTRDLTERKRAEEHARKLAAEQAARAESERTARYLAEASAVLARSLDPDVTLKSFARLLVPTLADWCGIDVLVDGEIRHVAVAHVDPAKVARVEEGQRRFPPDPDAKAGASHVIRTGVPELTPEITPEVYAAAVADPELRAILVDLGLRSAMVVPLLARGRVLGAMTLATAESERRYDEKDLAFARDLGMRAGLALDNARLYDEARRAVMIRDEFLSVASHELKTPLTALQLQLQSLQRLLEKGAMDSARLRPKAEKASLFAGRFEILVKQLLDVSRISAGRLVLDVERVDLAALAREVIDRFAEEAARAGCALELRDPGPVVCPCDRERIDQVLTNLLGNALKYGAGKPVQVRVSRDDHGVAIVVRDEGIGVPPGAPAPHLRALRARRVGAQLRRVRAGPLDLPRDRHRARRHHRGREHPRRRRHLPHRAPSHPTQSRLMTTDEHTVLVVDDDDDIRDSIREVLSDEGFAVALCADGFEALSYLRGNARPCVILLDLRMPRCDGTSFRMEQLKDPAIADIPVVLLSADTGVDQKGKALSVAAFLRKPVKLDTLLDTVARHCPCSPPGAPPSLPS